MVKVMELSTEQKNDVIKQRNEALKDKIIAKMLTLILERLILKWEKFSATKNISRYGSL